MAARLVKVFHVRLNIPQGAVNAPHPLGVFNRRPVPPRPPGDLTGGAKESGHAPVPLRVERPVDRPVLVSREEKSAVEDGKREQNVQPAASEEAGAKRRRRQSERDESLSVRDIAVTLAAVIVVSFGFTALLPSLLTNDAPAPLVASLPVRPPPSEPAGALQPAPAQLAVPAAPAPASVASTSAAKTAPSLRPSNIPSQPQAGGRSAVAGRSGTTAPEKTPEKTAAVAAPRRSAPTRPPLTDDEKAAIERGLRELEKAAGEAKP